MYRSTAAVSIGGIGIKLIGLVQRRSALVLYSSDELGDLSRWLCHDNSTISIVVHYHYY